MSPVKTVQRVGQQIGNILAGRPVGSGIGLTDAQKSAIPTVPHGGGQALVPDGKGGVIVVDVPRGGGGASRRPSDGISAPPVVYTSDLLQQSFTSQQAMQQAESTYRKKQEAEAKAKFDAERQAEQQKRAEHSKKIAEQRKIIVQASGGTRIGKTTYIGKTEVPGTGMTANEYRRYIRQQAIQTGQVKAEDVGRYTFTIQPRDEPIPFPEELTEFPIKTKPIPEELTKFSIPPLQIEQPDPLQVRLPTRTEKILSYVPEPITRIVPSVKRIVKGITEAPYVEKAKEVGEIAVEKIIRPFAESPTVSKVLDAPAAPKILSFVPGKVPEKLFPERTVGDIIATPSKVVRSGAKMMGEFYGDLYGKLPEDYRLMGIPPESRLEYAKTEDLLRRGEITREEATKKFDVLKTPVTPEEFGKGIETGVGIAPFVATGPVGTATLLASEVVAAREDYTNAAKIAEEEIPSLYKEYLNREKEIGEEDVSLKEYDSIIKPQLENEIKNQALVAMGVSGGFLIGGAAWKVGSTLKKYIPREKFTFGGRKLSQKAYDKVVKDIERSKISLAQQEKDIFRLREMREKAGVPETFLPSKGEGVSISVIGKARGAEIFDFADDLTKLKLFKTKEESIKFVKGMEKSKIDVRHGFKSSLEGVGESIKLPKVGEAFITKGDVYALSKSVREGGIDRSVTIYYQLGKTGKPINMGLQITTIPKNSKYAESVFYKVGKKGIYNVKDKVITDLGSVKVVKSGEDLFRRTDAIHRKVPFDKKKVTEFGLLEKLDDVSSVSELKELYGKGKQIERQAIFQKFSPAGVEYKEVLKVSDESIMRGLTEGKRYDVDTIGFGYRGSQKDIIKVPKLFKDVPEDIFKVSRRTPLDDTFKIKVGDSLLGVKQVKELKLPPQKLLIVPPGIKIIPPKTITKVSPIIKDVSTIPQERIIKTASLWYGKGAYERTDPSISFKEVDFIKVDGIIQHSLVEDKLVISAIPRIASATIGIPKVKTEVVTKLKPSQVAIPKIIPSIKQKEFLKTSISPKTKLTPLLKSKLIIKTRTPVSLIPIRPTRSKRPPRKPRVGIPVLEFIPSETKRKRIPPRPIEGFGIEIRRKGKFEKATPFLFKTKEGAEAIAMKKVLQEAAASYRIIRKKGKVIRTKKRPTPFQKFFFRPGKEKGVMVQKKLLRITTPGEVREISLVGAAARRKSPVLIKQPKKRSKKKSSKKTKSKGRKK